MKRGYLPFCSFWQLFAKCRLTGVNSTAQIWPHRGSWDTDVVVMTLFSKITGEVDKADAAFDALVRPRSRPSARSSLPSTSRFLFTFSPDGLSR